MLRTRGRTIATLGLLAGLALVAGCGSGGSPDPEPGVPAAASGQPADAPGSGSDDGSGATSDGGSDDGSDDGSGDGSDGVGGADGADDGDEAPLAPRDSGVSLSLSSAPFGDGTTTSQTEGASCQILTWEGDVLGDGVRLDVDSVWFDADGVSSGGGCEGGPACVDVVLGGDQTFCTVGVEVPAGTPSPVTGHLRGTLTCPDRAACDAAQDHATDFQVEVTQVPAGTDGGSGETSDGSGGTSGDAPVSGDAPTSDGDDTADDGSGSGGGGGDSGSGSADDSGSGGVPADAGSPSPGGE